MAPGESPAPFVVTGNVAGNRTGTIGMWQSRLSFAVGFLLSAGSAIAVAETVIQAGQMPASRGMSITEFVREGDDASVSTAPAPAVVRAPSDQDGTAVSQTRERRVLSFSLVEFVEKATVEGVAGVPPRISLVDLVASEIGQDLAVTDAASAPPRDEVGRQDNPRIASMASADMHSPPSPGATVAPVAEHALPVAQQVGAVTPTEIIAPLAARVLPAPLPAAAAPVSVSLPSSPNAVQAVVPPASLVQYSADSAVRPLSPLGTASPVQEASGTLLLFDAVRRALNEHPAIVESLSRLDAQQEQVSVARAGYWPQLRTGINSGYRHTTGRSEEALSVSASQMLYDFGKVSSAVDAATRGVDREQASVLLAAEDLIRETSQAFIEARRYEVLLALATEQIEAIAELEALAAKRSALGASNASDAMQARSRREAARAVQLQMQAQRDQWHSALENLIGSQQRLTLDDTWPAPLEGLCPRLPESFDNAPRIVLAEAERAEAEAAIQQARAEQRPTLSLKADFEHYLDRDTDGLQQLDDQELVVSLNLTSNLFQGGALRARSRAAEHALYSATAARDRALLDLSRLYRETRDRSLSLTSSLALQDGRHASIVKTQELYRHQYLSLGTRTLLDILNTEQEIFQTQVDKQNTLFDLRRLQIDCLYSVGGLRETFRAGDALNRRIMNRTEVGS